jgi:hypothetical protein
MACRIVTYLRTPNTNITVVLISKLKKKTTRFISSFHILFETTIKKIRIIYHFVDDAVNDIGYCLNNVVKVENKEVVDRFPVSRTELKFIFIFFI